MDDLIKRQDAIDALWKALYDYEDKTEKQFLESEELNTDDWFRHRIFVQNMSDIDRQTILKLPSAQQWIPWVENDDRLKDHYYYLVNHVGHGIPMLAKFHDDGCYFEIISMYPHKSIYVWDNDIITAWMPLPEIYKGETES